MRALIIDDESKARHLLRSILTEFCMQVDEIEEAGDLPEGVRAIQKYKPELVFLDIEMPGYSGLQILEFIDESQVNFEIIFTTAYDEYAVRAFDLNAVSYLLKPLSPEMVKEAVAKAALRRSRDQISTQLEALKDTLQKQSVRKIGLPVSDGILFLKVHEILYLQAEGMYTRFFTVEGESYLISKPLKHFVQLLSDLPSFVKPHRSYLINLAFVKQVVKSDGGYILMDNGDQVALSREKQQDVLELLHAGYT